MLIKTEILLTIFFIFAMEPIETNKASDEFQRSLIYIAKTYFNESSILLLHDKFFTRIPAQAKPDFSLLPNEVIYARHFLSRVIKSLMEDNRWSFQILNKNVEPFNSEIPPGRLSNAIVCLHEGMVINAKALKSQITKLRKNLSWDPFGKSLVIVLKNKIKLSNEEISLRIIRQLWTLTRTDDAVVMIGNVINGVVDFYTWFPFVQPECSKVKKIRYMDTWKDGRFVNNVDLYPEKITSNLNGCNFYVATDDCTPYVITDENFENETVIIDGLEVRIMNALAESLNFNVEIRKSSESLWSTASDNGTLLGAFKLLYNRKIDLAYSCLMLNYERYQLAEALPSYFDDSLTWFIPTPSLKSHELDIYDAFSPQFWICFFTTLLAINITVIGIVKSEQKFVDDQVHSHLSYVIKIIGLSVNSAVVFNTSSVVLRFFIFLICIYSTHITTAFQASLFGLYSSSKYQKIYQTLEDAVNDGLLVFLRESTNSLYNQSDHEIWNKILQPGCYNYSDDFEDVFKQIAEEKNAMGLFIKSTGIYMISSNFTNDFGLPNILHLKDRFASYPVTMYMSPGNPLFFKFQTRIYRMLCSGLVNHWLSEVLDESKAKKRFSNVDKVPLTLNHLDGAFSMMMFLLAFSTGVFLLEIIFYKFHQWYLNYTITSKLGKRRIKKISIKNTIYGRTMYWDMSIGERKKMKWL